MQEFDKIYFKCFGLELQEPLSLIFNWIIAGICLTTYLHLKKNKTKENLYFQYFFLTLSISTFFGGLGHLFFQYTGIYGKYPSWSLGLIANLFSCLAIANLLKEGRLKVWLKKIAIFKFIALIIGTFIINKFIFVAIDSIISYLIYCGFVAKKVYNEGYLSMKYFMIGVLILLPSAFIFLMNLNLSIWFNRDDFSHLLMVISLSFFSVGAKRINTFIP